MSTDRRQRRQRRRQLRTIGETTLKRGLPLRPSREQVLGGAVVLQDLLHDPSRLDRASRAAEAMHAVFEASMKAAPPKLELACRKGCGYCCHNWVGASAPELFLIARHLRAGAARGRGSSLVDLQRRLDVTRGASITERFGRKLPCALLADGACSIYALRPAVCRQATSVDLAACLEEYEGRDYDGEMTVSRVALDHAGNCRLILQTALAASGLPETIYELSAGITVALADAAESRWLAGDDPFRDIDTGPPEAADMRGAVAALAAELKALS